MRCHDVWGFNYNCKLAAQAPLCVPDCLLRSDDTGLGYGMPTPALVAAAADLVKPLLYSAGYAEVR